MTPREFAKKTGYSPSRIKDFCREGKVKAVKIWIPGGFTYDIPEAELKKLPPKDSRGRKPTDEN